MIANAPRGTVIESLPCSTADGSRFNEQMRADGRAILRVAKDMRSFLAGAPSDDADARSILSDCDRLELVGQWLSTVSAVTL